MRWQANAQLWAGHCQFEYENPDPEPNPRCGCCCDDGWFPWVGCHLEPTHIVQLLDGNYYRCCSADAHGLEVWWSAEFYSFPRWEGPFDQLLKRIYQPWRIESLVAMDRPFLRALPTN